MRVVRRPDRGVEVGAPRTVQSRRQTRRAGRGRRARSASSPGTSRLGHGAASSADQVLRSRGGHRGQEAGKGTARAAVDRAGRAAACCKLVLDVRRRRIGVAPGPDGRRAWRADAARSRTWEHLRWARCISAQRLQRVGAGRGRSCGPRDEPPPASRRSRCAGVLGAAAVGIGSRRARGRRDRVGRASSSGGLRSSVAAVSSTSPSAPPSASRRGRRARRARARPYPA